MIKYIEKKSANEHRQIIENFSKSMDSFDVEYEVDSLNNLTTLSFEEIKKWGETDFNNKYEALDYLYKFLGFDNKGGVIYG